MRTIILFILFTNAFNYCYSQNNSTNEWIYVGTASDKSRYYINTENISTNSMFKKVWVKILSPLTKVKKGGNEISYKDTKEMMLWEFNCKNMELRIIRSTLYLSDGSVVNSNPISNNFEPIIPESIGETVTKKACELFK